MSLRSISCSPAAEFSRSRMKRRLCSRQATSLCFRGGMRTSSETSRARPPRRSPISHRRPRRRGRSAVAAPARERSFSAAASFSRTHIRSSSRCHASCASMGPWNGSMPAFASCEGSCPSALPAPKPSSRASRMFSSHRRSGPTSSGGVTTARRWPRLETHRSAQPSASSMKSRSVLGRSPNWPREWRCRGRRSPLGSGRSSASRRSAT